MAQLYGFERLAPAPVVRARAADAHSPWMTKDTDPPDSIARFDHEEWKQAREAPEPADLRDQIQGPDDWLRPAVSADDPLFDVKGDGGLDVPRPKEQLPHELFDPARVNQVTRDVS